MEARSVRANGEKELAKELEASKERLQDPAYLMELKEAGLSGDGGHDLAGKKPCIWRITNGNRSSIPLS